MANYVAFMKWTDQGIRNYRDTVARAEAYRGTVERAGGRLVQMLWIAGEYDLVAFLEAPDDETAALLAFQLSALGNVRTTTMRAFTADAMKQIIARGLS
jgi:uncharacterized protein with GYD domain